MNQPNADKQPIDSDEPTSSTAKELITLICLMVVSVLAAWLVMVVWDFIT